MRKEILFAILAGSAVGLVVAFGVWKANRALQVEETSIASNRQEQDNSDSKPVENYDLVINTPIENQVFTTDEIEVTGLTSPNSYVIASVNGKDTIAESETGGAFAINVGLTGGLNEITITSFNNGDVLSKKVLVVYTSQLSENNDSEDAGEAESQTAMTYMGTVTDLTEDTVQLKGMDEEIKLISISEGTAYVRLGDETEDISFEDVAIGDFLMALGYTDNNEVLDSRRIIVSDPYEPTGLLAYRGVVTDNSDDQITIISEDTNHTVIAAKGMTTLDNDNGEAEEDFDDIVADSEIIAIGYDDDGDLSARTIFILSRPEVIEE